MKILHLASEVNAKGGGMPVYFRDFIKYFPSQNLFLSINMSKMPNESAINKISDNTNELVINVPNFFNIDSMDAHKYSEMTAYLFWAFNSFRPNLIIQHDWFWTPALKSLTKWAELSKIEMPKIYYFTHLLYSRLHQIFQESNPRIDASEEMAFYNYADRIIANSKSTEEDIATVYPEVKPIITTIPLGVDKSVYQPAPNLTSKIILYNGRLSTEKKIDRLLDDIRANLPLLQQYGMTIMFSGREGMVQDILDLQKETNGIVRYLGQIDGDEKMQVLNSAKYMVFPSEKEPYGLSLNEGLAKGKICVASDAGGHKEQIKNGKNGFLIKPEDSFIQKIIEIENNPKLQEKIVINAIPTARDIREHLQILKGVIDNDIPKIN